LANRTINRLINAAQDALSNIEDCSEFVTEEDHAKFDTLVSSLEDIAGNAEKAKDVHDDEDESDDDSEDDSEDEDEEEG
jgi:hypothetical protein